MSQSVELLRQIKDIQTYNNMAPIIIQIIKQSFTVNKNQNKQAKFLIQYIQELSQYYLQQSQSIFFALHILKQLQIKHQQVIVNVLVRSHLPEALRQIAQTDLKRQVFSNKEMGKDLILFCYQCLKYWSQKYPNDKKNNETVFMQQFKLLNQTVKINIKGYTFYNLQPMQIKQSKVNKSQKIPKPQPPTKSTLKEKSFIVMRKIAKFIEQVQQINLGFDDPEYLNNFKKIQKKNNLLKQELQVNLAQIFQQQQSLMSQGYKNLLFKCQDLFDQIKNSIDKANKKKITSEDIAISIQRVISEIKQNKDSLKEAGIQFLQQEESSHPNTNIPKNSLPKKQSKFQGSNFGFGFDQPKFQQKKQQDFGFGNNENVHFEQDKNFQFGQGFGKEDFGFQNFGNNPNPDEEQKGFGGDEFSQNNKDDWFNNKGGFEQHKVGDNRDSNVFTSPKIQSNTVIEDPFKSQPTFKMGANTNQQINNQNQKGFKINKNQDKQQKSDFFDPSQIKKQKNETDNFKEQPTGFFGRYDGIKDVTPALITTVKRFKLPQQCQFDQKFNLSQSKYSLHDFDKGIILTKQKYKGRTIPYDLQYFNDFNMKIPNSQGQSIRRFKSANIKQKFSLFQSTFFQIGSNSQIGFNSQTSSYYIKFCIFIGNKYMAQIQDVKLIFQKPRSKSFQLDMVIYKAQKGKRINVQPGKQKKINILIFPNGETDLLYTKFRYYVNNQRKEEHFFMPTLITKFLQFKKTSVNQFRKQWRRLKQTKMIRTEIFKLSTIIRNTAALKKYMSNFTQMNSLDAFIAQKEQTQYKLCGVAFLYEQQKYLIKARIRANHTGVFQMVYLNSLRNATELLLTLQFVFGHQ